MSISITALNERELTLWSLCICTVAQLHKSTVTKFCGRATTEHHDYTIMRSHNCKNVQLQIRIVAKSHNYKTAWLHSYKFA